MSGQNSIKVSQDEVVVELSDHDAMRPKHKHRHLYMIAMGGCIGTAFLVGSGRTLSRGGPALTLAGFVTMSSVVWVFATLMFEMAAYMPLDGASVDICPSNSPDLISGGAGAGSSPFVIGIKMAGIRMLDHIVNAVILGSGWSARNVHLYLASRFIYSLAVAGNAPKIFAMRNRWGRAMLGSHKLHGAHVARPPQCELVCWPSL
ncbi:hypothetical protein MY10362_000166 [Beauveria mimosiformis]